MSNTIKKMPAHNLLCSLFLIVLNMIQNTLKLFTVLVFYEVFVYSIYIYIYIFFSNFYLPETNAYTHLFPQRHEFVTSFTSKRRQQQSVCLLFVWILVVWLFTTRMHHSSVMLMVIIHTPFERYMSRYSRAVQLMAPLVRRGQSKSIVYVRNRRLESYDVRRIIHASLIQ